MPDKKKKNQSVTQQSGLREKCDEYKAGLEKKLITMLTDKLCGAGLPGVLIPSREIQTRLSSIRDKKHMSADDMLFIIHDVIKEPSAKFYEDNVDLCVAIQKYNTVNKLLDALSDDRLLRRTYLTHFHDMTKNKDSHDQHLIDALAKVLGKLFSPAQDVFPAMPTAKGYANDRVLVMATDRKRKEE